MFRTQRMDFTYIETIGEVDAVSRSGAVFHKTLLFSFVIKV